MNFVNIISQYNQEILLHGTGAIVERLHGLDFRITPSTFFQTNTVQAERLFGVTVAHHQQIAWSAVIAFSYICRDS